MNLAICSVGELYGGTEQFIYTFANGLRGSTRVQALVILFAKGALYDKLKAAGAEPEVIEPAFKYDLSVVFKLRSLFRARKIDVVHTHGYKANLFGGLAAKWEGLRVVKTEHGAIEPFATLPERVKISLNIRLDRALSRWIVDKIVYVSKDVQERIGPDYGELPGVVIYNGIPPIEVNGAGGLPDLEPGRFHIGIVGRLTVVKGHAFLLEALAQLKASDARLHIFGGGPLAAPLERDCVQKGIRGQVVFHGFTPNIHEYMSRLHLVVMPSLHEGFPYTLLESAYLKVPFIASAVGGIREVFENEKDCLLVEPRNVGQLKAAVQRIYGDRELGKVLAESAYRKVRENFVLDRMVRQYLEVYKN